METNARKFRFFRPPPRRAIPTRAGLFILSSPLVLGVAAVSATNNLLFMLLAASMVTVVVSGVLSERNMRGVEVQVRAMKSVFAGEPAALDVVFSRPAGAAPAYGLIARESPQGIWPPWRPKALVSPRILDAQLAVLEGRRGRVVGYRAFERRGPARLGPCELVTTYPFALLNKARDLDIACEVLVRPRRVPCPRALEDPRTLQIAGDAKDKRGLGLEVYGLRERQRWDSAHRVHALRSLTLGKEVVLELAGAERPAAWLGVAYGPGVAPGAWERALEIAQAVLTEWDRRGFAPGLSVGSARRPPGASSIDGLLDLIARAEPAAVDEPGPGLWLMPAGAPRPTFPGLTAPVEAEESGAAVRADRSVSMSAVGGGIA